MLVVRFAPGSAPFLRSLTKPNWAGQVAGLLMCLVGLALAARP